MSVPGVGDQALQTLILSPMSVPGVGDQALQTLILLLSPMSVPGVGAQALQTLILLLSPMSAPGVGDQALQTLILLLSPTSVPAVGDQGLQTTRSVVFQNSYVALIPYHVDRLSVIFIRWLPLDLSPSICPIVTRCFSFSFSRCALYIVPVVFQI